MKKINWFVWITMIATMGALFACSDSDDNDNGGTPPPIEGNTLMTVKGTIDLPEETGNLYEDCKIVSPESEANLSDGDFELDGYYNNTVQTFFVGDENHIYMLNRTPISSGKKVEMNVESTAIAMVTLHPLFASVDREDYATLLSFITSSDKYQAFYNEVEKCVVNKRPLYDDNNNDLIIAFSNLVEELCGEGEDDGNYGGSLDDVPESAQGLRSAKFNTRAIFEHSNINPEYIKAEINGKVLSLSTVWATPTYYGTVRLPNGVIQEKVIPACSDFGILDLTYYKVRGGEPTKFTFTEQGEYLFNFSRTTEDASIDFYVRLVSSILSMLGIDMKGNENAAVEVAKHVSNALIQAGANVTGGDNMSVTEWLKIAVFSTWEHINSKRTLGKLTFTEKFLQYSRFLAGTLNWYDKFKGAANFGLRIKFAVDAPERLDFCLCFYNNEVSTCAEAGLRLISGNNQTGYANQKLLEPLVVGIETVDENGNRIDGSSYHRVKFEVIEGGGKVDHDIVAADHNNQASTYWTLGASGEQKVRATVVDVITGKEISEPVEFTARMNTAAITIRLDWSKHSGNTDIDLHVIDPYGERIYYRNMSSASGGYLDRDDRVGPGPEHIRWTNAPEGTYQIYVHYYPNGASDRSVTTYKVSVTADGITYQPKSGSIAYDQMVGVGQFTIGGNNDARSATIEVVKDNQPFDTSKLPKKD